MMELHIDDRIVLISNRHGTSDNNPIQGSQWACSGTVVDIIDEHEDQNNITVVWDNDTQNVYGKADLELEAANGFRCKSIW